MYGIPPAEDFTPLLGQSVSFLCVGEFDIQIRLDRSARIAAYHSLTYECNGVAGSWNAGDPASARHLLQLIEKTIASIEVVTRSCMLIRFSDSSFLRLEDRQAEFECFLITWENTTIVI